MPSVTSAKDRVTAVIVFLQAEAEIQAAERFPSHHQEYVSLGYSAIIFSFPMTSAVFVPIERCTVSTNGLDASRPAHILA